jgi:hypothetical protein
MFNLGQWLGPNELRSKLRARGFRLPEYRAELCSALCDGAFSSAEYLAEADTVTLTNARRDPFDAPRPALAMSQFDRQVLEALGPLSPAARHASFYSKIDGHKLEEARSIVQSDGALVHDVLAQQEYCSKIARDFGFALEQHPFEQLKRSNVKQVGEFVARIGVELGRDSDARMPTDIVQIHMYVGLKHPKRYARYINTGLLFPTYLDYGVNYSMSPNLPSSPLTGARSPEGRSQLAKLAILAHVALLDELLLEWVEGGIEPIPKYLDALRGRQS